MFVTLESTDFAIFVQCKTTANVATAPDSAPSYRIISPAGSSLLTGNYDGSDVTSATGLRKAGSLSITAANGFAAGKSYVVRSQFVISSVTYTDIQRFTVV